MIFVAAATARRRRSISSFTQKVSCSCWCWRQFSRSLATTTTAATANEVTKAHNYCADLVRKADYEGYLTTLLFPKSAQQTVFALRALNIEVARVRELVRELAIGRLRLRFWKDTVETAFFQASGGVAGAAGAAALQPSKQPVSIALCSVLATTKLSKSFIMRLIQERDDRLGDPPFYSSKEVEQYGENTASMLLYLSLQSLGVVNVHADHAASHIGKAIGITTQLRALPYHLKHRRRLMLPMDIVAKHGLVEEDLIRGQIPAQFHDALFEFATLANDHLITARSFKSRVPSSAIPALLSSIPCEQFLNRLQKAKFDIFHNSVHHTNAFLPFTLWRKSMLQTY